MRPPPRQHARCPARVLPSTPPQRPCFCRAARELPPPESLRWAFYPRTCGRWRRRCAWRRWRMARGQRLAAAAAACPRYPAPCCCARPGTHGRRRTARAPPPRRMRHAQAALRVRRRRTQPLATRPTGRGVTGARREFALPGGGARRGAHAAAAAAKQRLAPPYRRGNWRAPPLLLPRGALGWGSAPRARAPPPLRRCSTPARESGARALRNGAAAVQHPRQRCEWPYPAPALRRCVAAGPPAAARHCGMPAARCNAKSCAVAAGVLQGASRGRRSLASQALGVRVGGRGARRGSEFYRVRGRDGRASG